MIFTGTRLSVFDNSGGRLAECIRVLGVNRRNYGIAGDVIIVSLKSINPSKKLLKGQISRAVIITTKKCITRPGGESVRFDKNGVVLVTEKNLPIATRVLSSVMLEVRLRGFIKVISIAKQTI